MRLSTGGFQEVAATAGRVPAGTYTLACASGGQGLYAARRLVFGDAAVVGALGLVLLALALGVGTLVVVRRARSAEDPGAAPVTVHGFNEVMSAPLPAGDPTAGERVAVVVTPALADIPGARPLRLWWDRASGLRPARPAGRAGVRDRGQSQTAVDVVGSRPRRPAAGGSPGATRPLLGHRRGAPGGCRRVGRLAPARLGHRPRPGHRRAPEGLGWRPVRLRQPEDSAADPGSPLRADGYLRPDVGSPAWPVDEARLLAWAHAALDCAGRQEALLASASARAVATAHSESAAACCVSSGARARRPARRPGCRDAPHRGGRRATAEQ